MNITKATLLINYNKRRGTGMCSSAAIYRSANCGYAKGERNIAIGCRG